MKEIELKLSKRAINEAIMHFEVSWSKESQWQVYNKKFKKPIVPAVATTDSGVTIGLGYDCGYNSAVNIRKDWSSILPKDQVDRLVACAGLKKWDAHAKLQGMQDIEVPIESALQVFYNTTIFKFAKFAYQVYPNLPNLHPTEQAVIIGLVYNRGNDLSGARRKEMKDLVGAIARDNDVEMANLIKSMKRLWADVKGLKLRRDAEATLILEKDLPLPIMDILIIKIAS